MTFLTKRKAADAIQLSVFWKTPDLGEGDDVMIRRLGDGKEYRGKIRGVYACDVNGSPDAYIVELVDKLPNQIYSCCVMPRGCVDSLLDITLKDITALPG